MRSFAATTIGRRTTDVSALFRLTVRSALYAEKRDSFGCQVPGCSCPRHLRLGLPDPDPRCLLRLRHIVRLESLIQVGCKFGPNDLTPDQWRDLIILAQERNWIDERVQAHREQLRKEQEQIDRALAEARRQSGIPPPGQSIFPHR